MSRATRDAVATDTGSTPLSLCGSTTGAPMAVDPFDPAALALRLADARERRARALASRKAATDAGESRPPLARPGPRSLAFGSIPVPLPGATGRTASAEPRPAPRIEPETPSEAHTHSRQALPGLALRIGLGLFAVALLAAGLVLAPLQVRRDIALLIAPDLEALPGADATAAMPRQPAAVLPDEESAPAAAVTPAATAPARPRPRPAVAQARPSTAEQPEAPSKPDAIAAIAVAQRSAPSAPMQLAGLGALGPRPPAAETRPATPPQPAPIASVPIEIGALSLLRSEPPGLRQRPAWAETLAALASGAGAALPNPPAIPEAPDVDGDPATSPAALAGLGETAPVRVAFPAVGPAQDVPGASASGRIRVRFQPSEAATQVGADVWFPGDPRLAAARDFVDFSLQPDPAGMKQPPAGSRKAAPRAEPARKAPARLNAPRAAPAQAQRAKLEQEVEAMLKVRLRDLRRR